MNSFAPSGTLPKTNGVSKSTPPGSADYVEAERSMQAPPSRYELQKRRDWNTFLQYLRNHMPPLTLTRCRGLHAIEFVSYLDQFWKSKFHMLGCPYFEHRLSLLWASSSAWPLVLSSEEAWGSLDVLVGRLRAAYEEKGGQQDSNLFAARAVRIYLRDVREGQAKAPGIPYEKKKRKRRKDTLASGSDVIVGGISNFHDA